MGLGNLWKSLRGEYSKVRGDQTTLLYEILRGSPPDEPERIYKRTATGEWQRKTRDSGFLKVRSGKLACRVSRWDDTNR